MKNIFKAINDKDYICPIKYYNFKEASAILNIKGLGRNNLLKLLRDNNIFDTYNQPTKDFENIGYFKTADDIFDTPLISNRGLEYIKRNLL